MRIHSLNCGTMTSGGPGEPPAVCHCLLIETDADGLVLVDTGLGTVNVKDPVGSLGEDFLGWAAPVLRSDETAIHQVEQLGFAASDVRHIVVTHLHRDHCGGLADFPDAAVHLHQAEHDVAVPGGGVYLDAAYRHGPQWVTYAGTAGDEWMGFDGVRQLDGLPPEILMVPLLGHTPGHVGVAVRGDDGWLLHAGDAYFHRNELQHDGRWPEAWDQLQANAETDRELRLANRDRLREAVLRPDGPLVFSAHDPVEYAERAGA